MSLCIGLFLHFKSEISENVLTDKSLKEMYRSNVKRKLNEMNRNTRITDQTLVIDKERIGWGQGTIEGAGFSTVNFFSDSEYDVSYRDVVLGKAPFSRYYIKDVS